MTRHRRIVRAVLVTGFLIGVGRPSAAQVAGVRAGVSADPDQFYVGAHIEAGPVADNLWFRPNLEIGFGDDDTLTAVNFEFVYKFRERRQPWQIYVGGGPALVISHHASESDAGGGFNILLGAEHRKGLFAEVKAGFIDSPSFKFGIGYTFR